MVTREQLIEQSTQEFVKNALFIERGYPSAKIEVMDAFPKDRFEGPLTKNYIAAGYGFDDQGQNIEMGSDVTRRVYTVEWFVFAMTSTWGRNLAHAIKFALEVDASIPLLNITEPEPWPTIDRLVVLGVNSEEVPVADPTPAEENMWRTVVRLEDIYVPALAWY